MKMKRIDLNGGRIIFDFGLNENLIIVERELARQMTEGERAELAESWPYHDFIVPDLRGYGQPENGWPCSVMEGKTAKGRTALRLGVGSSHLVKFYQGSGSRSWNGWDRRKPVGPGTHAFASAISNGGGRWFEITIVPADTVPVSAEAAE